jgi:hypothetical protein
MYGIEAGAGWYHAAVPVTRPAGRGIRRRETLRASRPVHVSPAGRDFQSSGIPGASFQFGRTSTHLSLRPHFPHLIFDWNHEISVSPGYFDSRSGLGACTHRCGRKQ